jgi:ribosomal protein L19E
MGKNTFTSGHGHAAFFVSARKVKFDKTVWEEVEENGKKKEVRKVVEVEEYLITIVEQFKTSSGIIRRELPNKGKRNGEYVDYSNNGEAFCVIL